MTKEFVHKREWFEKERRYICWLHPDAKDVHDCDLENRCLTSKCCHNNTPLTDDYEFNTYTCKTCGTQYPNNIESTYICNQKHQRYIQHYNSDIREGDIIKVHDNTHKEINWKTLEIESVSECDDEDSVTPQTFYWFKFKGIKNTFVLGSRNFEIIYSSSIKNKCLK